MSTAALHPLVCAFSFLCLYALHAACLQDLGGLQTSKEDNMNAALQVDTYTYAMQAARNGGVLQLLAPGSDGYAQLKLNGVGDTTAFLPNMYETQLNKIPTGPHHLLKMRLPRFAMLYTTTSENTAPSTNFRITSVRLIDSVFNASDDSIRYVVEILDPTAVINTVNVSAADVLLTPPLPMSFTQGNLLIDLVELNDRSTEHEKAASLQTMAASGELAYNVKRYEDELVSGHDPVKAHGLIRTGWMPLPTSPMYWVCCPMSLIVCPICLPWTIYCCF